MMKKIVPDIQSNIHAHTKIADVLRLTDEERAEMFDLAGRERNQAAPDLPEYIINENLPHVRAALRKAGDKWSDTIRTVMVEKAIAHRTGEITFVFKNGTDVKIGA